MRQVAKVENHSEIKRLMLYTCEDGVYLFGFDSDNDAPSKFDYLQDNIDEVYEISKDDYGVEIDAWIQIDNPMEYCQHDRIEPVRVVGINLGSPQWGRLEQLVEGKWVSV
ncbi:hypothetical protein HBG08_001171 [Vibrio parahaemolyticus]|nr:hypothetical protein [Vibrio parahaemolyticus]EGR0837763.1 hypothetical protein [Vibrio parahaemolyticus]